MKIYEIENIFDNDVPSVIINYMELYGNIDLGEIQTLKKLFSKIDKFELVEQNMLYDGLISDGLIMIPKEKNNMNIINENIISKYINKLMGNINNIEDGYFYKTLIILLEKINYISYEEQVILNFLFYELNLGTKKIEEIDSKNRYLIR